MDDAVDDPAAAPPDQSRRRVAVVLNSAAGALVGAPGASDSLRQAFADAGLDPVFLGEDGGTLPQRTARAVAMDAWAVVAAGGDGTVACAAQALVGHDTPLGILPFGTMNLLAKDLGLPMGDPAAAVRVLAAGIMRPIDVAEVNGHVFLCASMMGVPARLARHREAKRGDLAVGLWARMARAGLRAIARDAPIRLRLRLDGETLRLRAASLTIMANAVDESCGRSFGRSRLDGGELAIYLIERFTLGGIARLMLRMALGHWKHDPAVQERRTHSLDVLSGRRAMRVMNDGEVMLLAPPLRYRIRPGALRVIVPAPAPGI